MQSLNAASRQSKSGTEDEMAPKWPHEDKPRLSDVFAFVAATRNLSLELGLLRRDAAFLLHGVLAATET